MVEEMYLEEVKQEPNNSSQDNTTKRSKESSKELWSEANAAAQESGAMRFDQINILQSKTRAPKTNYTNKNPGGMWGKSIYTWIAFTTSVTHH